MLKEKGETIVIPTRLKKELDKLKIIKREPYYQVIERLKEEAGYGKGGKKCRKRC